jgi:hypothetical protein
VLLINRPEAAGPAAKKSGRPIGRAGPLRKFLRLTLCDLFLPFLSIFSTFYCPSGHFRPKNGHFYRILALFTALRVVKDLILAILSIFCTFNHSSGAFRPFLGHFSALSVVKFYNINKNSSNLSIS